MDPIEIFANDKFTIFNDDAIETLKRMPDDCLDAVIADLPYGRLKCKWDTPLDLPSMWKELWRVCKPNAPIMLFGDMQFGIELINSQKKYFKYEIVWDKVRHTTPFLINKRPGKITEYVFMFYKKQPVYNWKEMHTRHKVAKARKQNGEKASDEIIDFTRVKNECYRYEPRLPTNIFSQVAPHQSKLIRNVTEKPQELLCHLVKYFSEKNDLILDLTMGSGSTGEAVINCGRRFVGIELEEKHFEVAKARLEKMK